MQTRRPDRLRLGQPALGREGARRGRAPTAGAARSSSPTIPTIVAAADRIVLPGVGAFAACMDALQARAGLIEAMTEAVRERGVPFLGVCVGMQLLATRGLEFGEHAGPGLDRRRGAAARARPTRTLKVPHMGWNTLAAVSRPPAVRRRWTHGDAHVLHPLLRLLSRRTRPTWPPASTTAGASPRRWRGTTSPACSSTPRRSPGRRASPCLADFLEWRP